MELGSFLQMLSDSVGAGRESNEIAFWQMAVRAVLVYAVALALVRLSSTRFMGKNTALDLVLGVIIGSVLSRSLTGNAPLAPVFTAAAVLVLLHWLLAAASLRSARVSSLVKGNAAILIEDGRIHWENMRRFQIGDQDLREALRSKARVEDPARVKRAYFERSGEISVILQDE